MIFLVIIIFSFLFIESLEMNGSETGFSFIFNLNKNSFDDFFKIFLNNLLIFTVSIAFFGIGTQILYILNILYVISIFLTSVFITGNIETPILLIIPHVLFEILAFNIAIYIGYKLLFITIKLKNEHDVGVQKFKNEYKNILKSYMILFLLTFIGALVEVLISGGIV